MTKMPPYVVRCTDRDCGRPAAYKIAARWSDGVTDELKTYSLACPGCVAKLFALAKRKQAACRRAAGETLEPPGVYELTAGSRDKQLVRRKELET